MAKITGRCPSEASRILRKLSLLLLICLLTLCLAGLFTGPARASQGTAKDHANRLINSPNPYLLLHAHNPVDWYPWGPEALEKARRENKPIFLSIGYSTCYWCHVAERELYSDPGIAKLMNQWFINIKVDREERPDLDNIYIRATEALTGHGGWPNNLFLTPELKPFFAGSYFPPKARDGRPGFPDILKGLHKAWTSDHERVIEVADEVYGAIKQEGLTAAPLGGPPDITLWLDEALRESTALFDTANGGFGTGPTKFPKAPLLSMLLTSYEAGHDEKTLKMLTSTLMAMARGGLMDQLGGGFHRYSTDPGWDIPHFEKMLYDNAELLGIYARAYAITKTPFFRLVTLRTAQYLMDEMEAPGSGFFSAQDAEVKGIEGINYVWTRKEIESSLTTAEARRFFSLYALTPMPPAPMGHRQTPGGVLRIKAGKDVKSGKEIEALMPLTKRLLAMRQRRAAPARDEKIVISDNALAVIGFTTAATALDDAELRQEALKTARWIWTHAFNAKTGKMRHQFFKGHGGGPGFLDDYALTGEAFLAIYHTTGSKLWLKRAKEVTDAMLRRFVRPDGSLETSENKKYLIVNPPPTGDSTRPSGRSSAIGLLLDMAATSHETRYSSSALRALAPLNTMISSSPASWGSLLASLGRPPLRKALIQPARQGKKAVKKISAESAAHVHASGQWQDDPKGVDIILRVSIDEGYHINANPPSESYLVATELVLNGYPSAKVNYPSSKDFKAKFASTSIAVYDGDITITAHLPSPLSSSPPESVGLRVQACNDTLCLAPALIRVPVRAVGRPKKK